MDKDRAVLINISQSGWRPCTDTSYPTDDMDIVIVAFYDESDKKWYHWTYEECPYGWNVLCRSQAYWQKLYNPIEANENE